MSIMLNIKYEEKDLFKSCGGAWDKELKLWYIPSNAKIKSFENWFSPECRVIVKSPFYIALSSRICWKCNERIPLIAIGADGYIFKEEYDDERSEWHIYKDFTLFQSISYLPKQIIELIQKDFTYFNFTYSKTEGMKTWANNCNKCGALQGDWFSHNELGGAFFPSSSQEAKEIILRKYNFAYDFPIIASLSVGLPTDMISDYAKRL